ncbi:MAG TPA: cupin domain-containing protein [Streptosporangiaceae bacterium]
MASRHLVSKAADRAFAEPAPWARAAKGFRRATIVDDSTVAAVHTGFVICELDPGGSVPAHVHSFEQSFYMLDGSVVLDTGEGSALLSAGDYGLVPTGVPHSWRNTGDAVARWADMQAPQPRSGHGDDTYAVPAPRRSEAAPPDVRDPRNLAYGHITAANMDVGKQSQNNLAVSASMRTALLVYSGITVKMMVDSDLGARLSTMFMVQYEPDGVAGPHDHPFEETYLILEGATDATFDGQRYRLEVGDVAWAGVGCVHSFSNAGDGPVRWLETQAPQPPSRHSYRFARDWDYLQEKLT